LARARDANLLSALLQDFADAARIDALRPVGEAVASTGAAMVLLHLVMPDHDADLTSASFDMQMFIDKRRRDSTNEAWQAVLGGSGLVLEEVVLLASFVSTLVLRQTTDH
jgi:hypothetical protein